MGGENEKEEEARKGGGEKEEGGGKEAAGIGEGAGQRREGLYKGQYQGFPKAHKNLVHVAASQRYY